MFFISFGMVILFIPGACNAASDPAKAFGSECPGSRSRRRRLPGFSECEGSWPIAVAEEAPSTGRMMPDGPAGPRKGCVAFLVLFKVEFGPCVVKRYKKTRK